MTKFQFKVEDIVVIYKNTPTFEDGTVAQVIDRDPNDETYAVADLRDVGRADSDIGIILNRYVKWVEPKNMRKISFSKSNSNGINRYVGMGLIALSILCFSMAIGVYFG